MDRHSRQTRLAEVGAAGQARLAKATAAVRLDGLSGNVAARYLAGAGLGLVRVRNQRTASAVAAVDPAVRAVVEPELRDADVVDAFDLRDPIARELARGARAALQAIRIALADPDHAGEHLA
jgi:hypothetical protein